MTNPTRVVSDYSAEELIQFRNRFRTLAEQHRRQGHKFLLLATLFIVFVVLSVATKDNVWVFLLFWLMAIGTMAYIFRTARSPHLICPACAEGLDRGIGAYCPECGSSSLKRGGWLRWTQCSACAKKLRSGKHGRKYRIHACTHCGVQLDEKGV